MEPVWVDVLCLRDGHALYECKAGTRLQMLWPTYHALHREQPERWWLVSTEIVAQEARKKWYTKKR